MKFKIIALALTCILGLTALKSYTFYASQQKTTALFKESRLQNKVIRPKILESNSINQAKNKIHSKRFKNFKTLVETPDYLAYLPDDNNKSAFNKISVAKSSLYDLSFDEWIQKNTSDDFAVKLLDSKETIINNRKAVQHRYISELHRKNKVSMVYIDFDDSLMSIGIHGDTNQSFEELELELERFANELE